MAKNLERASIAPIVKDLEAMFDKANKTFYNGALDLPVITLSPSSKSEYGWFTTWKAWKDDSITEGAYADGYYEINICSEYLNRPIENVVGTLLHEMVHLYCQINGIKDTSRHGMYHNEKFKATAEEHGLIIEKADKIGWSITTLNDAGKKFLAGLKHDGFTLHRVIVDKSKKPITRKSNSIKYVCPCCSNSVRATKSVSIMCIDCEEKMLPEI